MKVSRTASRTASRPQPEEAKHALVPSCGLWHAFDLLARHAHGVAVCTLDPAGRIASWNAGAETLILLEAIREPDPRTGFASILEDEVAGPLNVQQKSYLKKILHGADRMLFQVNNLLDISRLSAGKLNITPSYTRYDGVIAHVLEHLQAHADERNLRLEAHVEVREELLLDGPRIRQVLNNLVDNAIKFTPPGGHVRVRAYRQGNALVTEIHDTGVGLAPLDLPKLFQRFSQLDMTSTRTAGGTGLGLAICKAIVETHGGRIGARSQGPGHGSTFWFSLPLAPEPPSESASPSRGMPDPIPPFPSPPEEPDRS